MRSSESEASVNAQRDRTKVAVTGLRGIPGVMGGIETHCEELLPRIAALAPEMEITVLGRAPYLPNHLNWFRGVAVKPLPTLRRPGLEAVISTFTGVLHARRRGFDLLHIHAIGPGLLAPLARMLGMTVVLTHHGVDYDRAKWGRFARLMLKLGERWGVAAAHHVIAVSPSLFISLRERFPRHARKISHIPNGAPALEHASESREAALDRLGLEQGGFILAVGRLVPEKGFDYLIDAFRASGSDKTLAIVGASDHDSEFARRLSSMADGRVRFLGLQPRSVLRHLYESTALFVLPSFHEGLPIVALEAGRCGAPMLMSDIPANRDVGLPNANYFPVGDVDALAEALRTPAETFGVNGDEIRRRFNWDVVAHAATDVYRKVACRGSSVASLRARSPSPSEAEVASRDEAFTG